MFSDENGISVDYHPGTSFTLTGRPHSLSIESRQANTLLLASFMTVRNNSEEACSNALLKDLSEEDQAMYRENSKIGQNNIKLISNDTSRSFDACIRRSFSIKTDY